MTTGESRITRARAHAADDTRRARGKGLLAVTMGVLMALGGVFGAAQVASAAPTVTYDTAISNITLAKTQGTGPLGQWQDVRIAGEWAVPAGAAAGETFGMTLPAEFSRKGGGEFSIVDPDSNAVLALCQVAAGAGPELICTLTSAVEGLESVGGEFWLQAQASQSTTSETVEFDVGGTIQIVDLPGEGGIIPENVTEPAQPYKYGGSTDVDGTMRWVIGIPSGYVADGAFTITDQIDPTLKAHQYTGTVRLMQRAVENGTMVGDWTAVDPARYTVTFAPDNQSFQFAASGLPTSGFSYRLIYNTVADDMVLKGDQFGNQAVVNTTTVKAVHTVVESGGGSGSGETYTQFSITKALTGAQADAARGATYTVQYSVKGSDAPATKLTVPVGQSVASERALLGSTFIIQEIDLPAIEGVTWGAWTITGEGVTALADGTYEVTPGSAAGVAITLTNTANATPVVEPTPKPTPVPTPKTVQTSPPSELALTGGGASPELLAIALALIAGGAIAGGVTLRRRMTSTRR